MAKTTPPTFKLSDTQLVLLNVAAQRDDGALLPLPKTLRAKGAALAKIVATLSRHGLIEERPVAANAPQWRRNADGLATGLFLTDVGLKVLDPQVTETHAGESSKVSKRRPPGAKTGDPHASGARRKVISPKTSTKKHRDSKQDLVVQMLRRKSGVSLAEIVAKTSWKAHSVRGFLSAVVRKKLGLPLVSEKSEDSVRRYHIAAVTGRGS